MSDKPFKSQCSGPRHRIKKGRQDSTNHSSISCYNHHGGRASLAHHSIVRWGYSHIGIYTRFLLGYHPRSAIYITWLGPRVISSIIRYLATYAVVTSLATYLGPRGCTGHALRVAIKTSKVTLTQELLLATMKANLEPSRRGSTSRGLRIYCLSPSLKMMASVTHMTH